MKEIASKALAWSLAHWDVVLGVLSLLAYAWLNAKNARTEVEKRAGSRIVRAIDRLAVLTMQGAKNKASAPVLGKSIADAARAEIGEDFDAIKAEIDAERERMKPRETQAPPPPSEPGYVEPWVLVALVVAVIAALAAGCSGGSLRDALRFNGVREVRHPVHGDCIEASLTVTTESINRSGTGYLGVCRGVLDAGAVSDAGVSE